MIRCDPEFLFNICPFTEDRPPGSPRTAGLRLQREKPGRITRKITENRAKIAGVVKLHKKQAESLEAATFVGQNRTENVFEKETLTRRR